MSCLIALICYALAIAPASALAPAVADDTGIHIISYSAVTEATLPSLSAALLTCGGKTLGYLPPASFLVYSGTLGCLSTLPSHLSVLSLSPYPVERRLDPRLPHASALRVLQLTLAAPVEPGAFSAHLQAHCPACTVSQASPLVARVSTLPGCSQLCALDAPAACGCTLPLALAAALAAHPLVLHVSLHTPAYPYNAFGLGALQTPDLGSSPTAGQEFGACPDPSCSQASGLAFSTLPATYGPMPLPPSARLLQGATPCSPTCASLACGSGFGGGCGGLGTPIQARLTGAGQLLHVIDTGLDAASPYFLDTALPAPPTTTLPALALSAHRKVAAYFAYADGVDGAAGVGPGGLGPRGHGTHVCGSAAGSPTGPGAPPLAPGDAPVLTAFAGGAPAARLIVTDVGCDTAGGCNRTGVLPFRSTPCAFGGALCLPDDPTALFPGAAAAGSFVTLNSYGSGALPTPSGNSPGAFDSLYTPLSEAMDAYARAHPQQLLVFAAGDSGNVLSVSEQGVAKNVLTIGASADGLFAHTAKIRGLPGLLPALYQDGRGCPAMLASTSITCPAATAATGRPAPSACFTLMLQSQNASGVQGGFPIDQSDPTIQFRPFQFLYALGAQPTPCAGDPSNAELALCCGCTLADVVEPCRGGWCPDGTNLTDRLAGLTKVYNGRFPAVFASKGPVSQAAAPARIKVRAGGCPVRALRSTHGTLSRSLTRTRTRTHAHAHCYPCLTSAA